MKKTIMIVALAITGAALLACNKDGENTGNGSEKNVFIKISTPAAKTRGVGEKVTDGHALELKPGFIYFTDRFGQIKKSVEMVAGTAAGNQVSITELTGPQGAVISAVPSVVTDCHIFANIPAAVLSAMGTPSNISEVKSQAIAVEALADASCGVSNVPQSGVGKVNVVGDKYTANVEVFARGARLQIAKISSKAAADGTTISSFTLNGIFVNNFYKEMTVIGGAADAMLMNNGSNTTYYGGSDDKYVGKYSVLADYSSNFATPLAPQGVAATPTAPTGTTLTTPVWAYNILPTAGITTADASNKVPHIVIRLSKITVKNSDAKYRLIDGDMFITVKGMIDNGVAITQIDNGMIYTFKDIRFSYDNLSSVPEASAIDTEVTVDLIPWKEIEVEPDMR